MENNNVIAGIEQYELDDITTRLSSNILYENLKEQIEATIIMSYQPVDIIENFNSRYDLIKLRYEDSNEVISAIMDEKIALHEEILTGVEDKFGLTTNIKQSEILNEDFFLYVRMLYKLFILDYKENLTDYFKDVIIRDKKSYIDTYKDDINRKDIAVKSLKRVFKSIDEVTLIVKLYDIVEGIKSSNTNSDVILEDIINIDDMEISKSIVNEIFFEENEVVAFVNKKFYENFFAPLDKSSMERSDLLIDIKTKVMKSLPKSE